MESLAEFLGPAVAVALSIVVALALEWLCLRAAFLALATISARACPEALPQGVPGNVVTGEGNLAPSMLAARGGRP